MSEPGFEAGAEGWRCGARPSRSACSSCCAALLFWLDPENLYLWAKAIHVIAVIAWMAGMLYLPRLFVYHTEAASGSEQSETFKVMERRLLRVIINPAMIVTWVFGLWLAWKGFGFQGGWLHAKIALVVAMSGMHGYLGGFGAALCRGPQPEIGAPLADGQRSSDLADDRHRHPGRSSSRSDERAAPIPALLFVGRLRLKDDSSFLVTCRLTAYSWPPSDDHRIPPIRLPRTAHPESIHAGNETSEFKNKKPPS